MKLKLSSCNSRTPRAKRGGFTLLELLTTVGIIGILVALLIPAAKRGLESARQAKCAGVLRQVGVATLLAAADNNNQLLLYSYTPAQNGNPAQGSTWTDTVAPYGVAAKDCMCPSLPGKPGQYTCLGRRQTGDFDDSLIYNGYKGTAEGGSDWLYLNRVTSPSTYVMYGDAVWPLTAPASRAGQQASSFYIKSTADNPGIHLRHNDMANIAFLDGHVVSVSAKQLANLGISTGFDKNIQFRTWPK